MKHYLGVLLDTDRDYPVDIARFIYGRLAYKDRSTAEKNLVSASGIRVEAKIFTDAAYVTFYTGSARQTGCSQCKGEGNRGPRRDSVFYLNDVKGEPRRIWSRVGS